MYLEALFFKDSQILNGMNYLDVFVVVCIPMPEVGCHEQLFGIFRWRKITLFFARGNGQVAMIT